uniref:Thioredoxin domain-containing protein n=1 Tax=Hucho hucho TaxID=62062 RepID=A0A4W5Q275_9TELE
MARTWEKLALSLQDNADVHIAKVDATDDVELNSLARLVMFHAPWCGHCNKLLPTFGKVATALKAKNIIAGSIDGTNVANRPLMQAFRVASYPTILMLHDDSYTLFEGDRSVDALVAFADGGYTTTSTKKDMPVIPTAEAIQPEQAKKQDTPTEMAKNVHVAEWTATIFDTVLQGPANGSASSSELFLVEFYAQWCGPCRAFAAAYEAIAEDLKSDMVVARIDGALEEELRTRLNVESYPSVLLVDKTKRLVYAFPSKDERTKDAVLDFVKGGYKATTPTALPHPPSALHIMLQSFSLAVSELLALRLETMAAVLALGGGLGYTFAVMRSPKKLPKGLTKAKKNEGHGRGSNGSKVGPFPRSGRGFPRKAERTRRPAPKSHTLQDPRSKRRAHELKPSPNWLRQSNS